MRTAFIIIIALHALIHLMGFLKGFGISEFEGLSQPVSKTYGFLWLLAFLLLAFTLVLFATHSDFWWLSGIFSVILSQVLILVFWSDAKFGTLINLIILIASVVAWSNHAFLSKVEKEKAGIIQNSETFSDEIITAEDISHLPNVVKKWLTNSEVIGKQRVPTVYLTQELLLKMKPDQESWYRGSAEQFFSVRPPAFIWTIDMKMNPIMPVAGRDKFEAGKGEMLIKLLSLIPVANARDHEKVNQATLQRYLAEIVWFPSAALSDYIKWEALNEYSAKAIMTYEGTRGEGIFHFDHSGRFKKFTAMRFQDSEKAEPTEWIVTATKTDTRNGVKIPVECEASWKMNDSTWTWLKLKITDISYGN
ncbi:DUF6920 family protein [Robertkochia aurantiaca]|uniref:DUF6920 family protein n=1 Tax=Robertkochia aurantiaca TaxID=2873700 RepID=UPI001CCB67B1|nr:DUF6544 family protein [Robertkochia sp. 3YJGBD-33]